MRVLFIILLCSICLPLSAQTLDNNNPEGTLTIRITDLKKNKGFVMVALFNKESKFLKTFDITKRKKVTEKEDVIVFKALPFGTYAVSVFQDINGNNSLDGNFLGIPKEPYGFSNNPSTMFGPPKFKKASFSLKAKHKQITIKL